MGKIWGEGARARSMGLHDTGGVAGGPRAGVCGGGGWAWDGGWAGVGVGGEAGRWSGG